MADQPEALRLAAALEVRGFLGTTAHEAAAELRRLYAENALLHERHHFDNGVLKELLDALKQALEECIWPNERLSDVYDKARAAIAKAECKE